MATAEYFNIHTPPKILAELEIMEVDVCLERITTPYRDIYVNLTAWIHDTRSSRLRETEYHCIIDLYWNVKALLGKVMVDKQVGNSEFSLQLEYLQLHIKAMDQKVSLLVENIAGLNFNEPSEGIPQVP
jgi:hypothetical protein